MVLRTRVCAGCLSRALLLAGMTAWPIRTSGERDESAAAEAPWRRLQQGGENPRVEQFPGIGYQMDVNGDGRVSSQEFDDWTQESRAQQFGSAVTTHASAPGLADLAQASPELLCAVLMELDGSCALELSELDPSAAPGTLVSTICPAQCAGRAHCTTPALEVPLLSAAAEHDVDEALATITTEGTACVDAGGARFDGDGGITIQPQQSLYGSAGSFSLSFWIAKDLGRYEAKNAPLHNKARGGDTPLHPFGGVAMETIFAHGSYDDDGANRVLVALKRSEWLESYDLVVEVRDAVRAPRNLTASPPEMDSGLSFVGYTTVPDNPGGGFGNHLWYGMDDPNEHLNGFCRERYGNSARVITLEEQMYGFVGDQPPSASDIIDFGTSYINLANWDNDDHEAGRFGTCSMITTFQHGHGWPSSFKQTNCGCGGRSEGEGALIACGRDHGEADVRASFPIPLMQDDLPRWSHVALTVDATAGLRVFQDGTLLTGGENSLAEGSLTANFAAFAFREAIRVGYFARSHGADQEYVDVHMPLYGTVSMLRVFDEALSDQGLACLHETSSRLVSSGRMDVDSICIDESSGRVTGCTHPFAINFDHAATVDDGSCQHRILQSAFSELGFVTTGQEWVTIDLSLAYARPVVLLGVPGRHGANIAVPRMRRLEIQNGAWSFQVSLEQTSCRVDEQQADDAEEISWVTMEAGIAADQSWQAGVAAVRGGSWHRVSFLEHFSQHQAQSEHTPVVVSQVQSDFFGGRVSQVTVRQVMQAPGLRKLKSSQRRAQLGSHLGFFARLDGTGTLCDDNVFYQELFAGFEAAGEPVITSCLDPGSVILAHSRVDANGARTDTSTLAQAAGVQNVVNWAAAACRGRNTNVQPTVIQDFVCDHLRSFSGRWTARVTFSNPSLPYVFSTDARNTAVRVVLDHATIIDRVDQLENGGGVWSSPPIVVTAGYHTIRLEWHGAMSSLWWSVDSSVSQDDTAADYQPQGLMEDVGWFATTAGRSQTGDLIYAAGLASCDFFASINFAAGFRKTPFIFASFATNNDPDTAHFRLVDASLSSAQVLAEEAVCSGAQAERRVESVAWLAVERTQGATNLTRVPTLTADTTALLGVHDRLVLADYMRWENGTDPCAQLWLGVSCTFAEGRPSSVVALELENLDLTGLTVPWELLHSLSGLRELALGGNSLVGSMSTLLCEMHNLFSISLERNQLRGTIPECLSSLGNLRVLLLNDNRLHGPLLRTSQLGLFIKQVAVHNLDRNHWAPVLPSDKQALGNIAGGFDDTALQDWDLSWSYEVVAAQENWHAMLRNHTEHGDLDRLPFHLPFFGQGHEWVEIRHDKAAVHFYPTLADAEEGFEYVGCFQKFELDADTGDCEYHAGDRTGGSQVMLGTAPTAADCTAKAWQMEAQATGVSFSSADGDCRANIGATGLHKRHGWQTCVFVDTTGIGVADVDTFHAAVDLPFSLWEMDSPSASSCARHCHGYEYMALSGQAHCSCGNEFGVFGESDACGDVGVRCANPLFSGECQISNAVYRLEDRPSVIAFAPEVNCLDDRAHQYMGCFTNPALSDVHELTGPRDALINSGDQYDMDTGAVLMENPSVDQCTSICVGFAFVGLQAPNICWCADTYDSLDSVAEGCGPEGELCFTLAENRTTTCSHSVAIFAVSSGSTGALEPEEIECLDDADGLLRSVGYTCETILVRAMMIATGCTSDLSSIEGSLSAGTLISDACPITCDTCPEPPPRECWQLPVLSVSTYNTSDVFQIQWYFEGTRDTNDLVAAEVQVTINPDGRIDMHMRSTAPDVGASQPIGIFGVVGAAEQSVEADSTTEPRPSRGFLYKSSDP
jgi:hypothetical protein